MRLLSCEIENFGRLSHYTYIFGEGISQIAEENGFGKSTFCAFLLSMFYGFDTDRKRGLGSERRFYEPWQGGTYGGSVSFEARGKRYRLTRLFGKKESEDSFALYDLDTNLLSSDYSEAIGEELFQIDRNSFMKTAFIGQDALLTEATDHVNALIGNLSESDSDMTSYEKTDGRLKQYLDSHTPRRKTGSLYKTNEEIGRLKVEEGKGPAIEAALQQLSAQMEENEAAAAELKAQGAKAQAELEKATEAALNRQLLSQHERLQAQKTQRSQQAEALRSVFPAAIPEQFEFLAAINAGTAYKQAGLKQEEARFSEEEAARFEAGNRLFAHGLPTDDEMTQMVGKAYRLEDIRKELQARALTPHEKQRYEMLARLYETDRKDPAARARTRTGLGIGCLILGLVCALLTGFLIMQDGFRLGGFIAAGAVFAAGLLLLLTAQVRRKEAEKTEWKALLEKKDAVDEEGLSKEAERLSGTLDAFLLRFGLQNEDERYTDDLFSLSSRAAAHEKLLAKQAAYDKAAAEAGYEKRMLDAFFGKLGIAAQADVTAQLNSLLTTRSAYMNALKNEAEAVEELERFEGLHDIRALREKLAGTQETDLEDAKQHAASIAEQLDVKRRERNALTRQFEDLREELEYWNEGHENLLRLQEQYDEGVEKYRLVEKTRKLLENAKDALTNRYSAPLLHAFNDYYEQLTGRQEDRYLL
ncbi:MAG: AAA family ATPase, partial [Lachnospiraceae bacterium]|nr:AAA family ATPase [Lachnospiraceae bacterium]